LLTFVILFLAFLVLFTMRFVAGKTGLPVAPSGAVGVFYGVVIPLTTSIFPAELPIIRDFRWSGQFHRPVPDQCNATCHANV
jgi:hypothetical protein